MIRTGRIKNFIWRGAGQVVGRDRVNKIILKRNFAFYKRAGIVFVHIPKCAGSSVSEVLYGRSLGHWPAAHLKNYNGDLFDDLDSFAVIRDPVLRARSAWSYCRVGGTKEGWIESRAEYKDPSFVSFDRFATEWLPKKNLADLDPVFRSQTSFVTGANEELLVDRLVSVDDLHQWFMEVSKDIANVNSLPRKNLNLNNIDELVSNEARDAIENIYRCDVDLLSNYQGIHI